MAKRTFGREFKVEAVRKGQHAVGKRPPIQYGHDGVSRLRVSGTLWRRLFRMYRLK